MWFKSLIIFQL